MVDRVMIRLSPRESSALDRLERTTRDRGRHMTSQRILILICFLRLRRPATIEDVRKAVASKYPRIGYSTVGRTMEVLVAAGLARRSQGAPFVYTAKRGWRASTVKGST